MLTVLRFLRAGDPVPDPDPAAVRVVRWTTRRDLTPDAPWEAVHVEHLGDDAHVAPGSGPTVVARAHILRGAEWLHARWRDRATRLVHVALAHRAPGLEFDEFLGRWRHHAGASGGLTIPDDARGQAYVQHHPVVDLARVYDAVNAVWFDDTEGLRARLDWFEAHPPVADDLFGESRFLAVDEEILALR